MNYAAYRLLTRALTPLLPVYLERRKRRGKEDAARIRERFGHASVARPPGKLCWLHAASVGEANAILPLITALRARYPVLTLLLTTGTVTSAALMQQRLPNGVIHHYMPVDTPAAAKRFLDHWRPDIVLWSESELWPNLLLGAHKRGVRMALLNARMSERSHASWQRHQALAARTLNVFTHILAQSADDAKRFEALCSRPVQTLGNLKYDAEPLPYDPTSLRELRDAIAGRPVWLAASTHPKEEEIVIRVHRAVNIPTLLTIIVPRHAARGSEIAALADGNAALRSQNTLPDPGTEFYIADTMGELGLFYRLCPLAFIGGSLIEHGGQNIVEAARLGCALVTGPHMFNFSEAAASLKAERALIQISGEQQLAHEIKRLLADPAHVKSMGDSGRLWVEARRGALARVLNHIAPMMEEVLHAHT